MPGFPGSPAVKNSPANTGDPDSIPGLGRALGEGNGNPLQYSCIPAWEIPLMEEPGGLQTRGPKESDTTACC